MTQQAGTFAVGTMNIDIPAGGFAALPTYYKHVSLPLATADDIVDVPLFDVTPGDYQVSCMMDTIYGGTFPGTGSLLNFPYTPISVAAGADNEVAVQLQAAL